MTRRLKIDLGELAIAMDSYSYEHRFYLDLETGEIVLVQEEFTMKLEDIYQEILDEEGNEIISLEAYLDAQGIHDWQREALLDADRVERGYGSRYIAVKADSPYEGYNDMERFIATVEDDALYQRLSSAIRGRGAFGRFKSIVHQDADLLEAWYAFEQAQSERRVRDWLERYDIEPID